MSINNLVNFEISIDEIKLWHCMKSLSFQICRLGELKYLLIFMESTVWYGLTGYQVPRVESIVHYNLQDKKKKKKT